MRSSKYINLAGRSTNPHRLSMKWKLTLAYDGTAYHGWQVQPGLSTVQGTLADAIERLTGERVLPQGSGRTDAGVHALAQVASCVLEASIPPANLLRALNRVLPQCIRVRSAEHVPEDFHARHSAIAKTYEYRIFPLPTEGGSLEVDAGSICEPFLSRYVWSCPWPVSLDLLNDAAAHILGTHDFASFAASDPDLQTRGAQPKPPPIRTIHRSSWQLRDGLAVYRVTGSGFLHHMVRNLVGTFVQAGAGRLDPETIPSILGARDRSAAGPTAPAQGLFLVSVEYPPDAEPSS
jgi:tRNA pseudouridine38-40 synthase